MTAVKPGGFVPVVHAATKTRPDEIDTLVAAEAVAGALATLGFSTEIIPVDLNVRDFEALQRQHPLLVFNLVDAVRGDGRLAPVIPSLMDALGLRYTGAHSDAWLETLSKVATKLKLQREGLPTPDFSIDESGFDPDAPVIVKSAWEHGSLGLDGSSVVTGAEAGRAIKERNARYRTDHFAEAYIEGREFNLALLEGTRGAVVLPIAEILFEGWPEGAPRIVGLRRQMDARERGLYRHAAALRARAERAQACRQTDRACARLLDPVRSRRLRPGRLPRR